MINDKNYFLQPLKVLEYGMCGYTEGGAVQPTFVNISALANVTDSWRPNPIDDTVPFTLPPYTALMNSSIIHCHVYARIANTAYVIVFST